MRAPLNHRFGDIDLPHRLTGCGAWINFIYRAGRRCGELQRFPLARTWSARAFKLAMEHCMMFKAIVGGACGVALLGALAACGSSESGVDEVRDVVAEARGAQDESSATTVVPAGEASAQLGVARWEGYADAIYGFEGNGKVVAEFHSTDRGLESVLPEEGLLTDAGSGFSELTQRYYDAFSADAQNVVPDGADASAAVAASGLVFVDCYLNLATCFRDRDLIFQQTRIVCVCQPPDTDQFCGTSLVDLECNL